VTELASPRSLAEAVEMLGEKPWLRPIAGCTDLMVCDPVRRSSMGGVLDLLQIPELRGITETPGGLEIGATTTFAEIGRSALVNDRLPALAAAAQVVGGWQIQNRATIGGNVINASPAGDSLPALLALEAQVTLAGPNGVRKIPFSSFYSGYRQTEMKEGELLARLFIPDPTPGTRQFFRKIGTREAQAISKVVIALAGRVEDSVIADFRLAAGSVAATPVRLTAVEQAVIGRTVGPEVAELGGQCASESVEPIDDVRSTAAYRRFVLGRIVRRMTLALGSPGLDV
jgi:CO/xanthine dehydrogenase FAD-binding subunit